MDEFIFQKAERKQSKVRIMIAGPAGSGKSYSALRLATGICRKIDGGKIAMIGTERYRNEIYAPKYNYDVLNLDAPYSPERYIKAIEAAENAGYNVCIVDSTTHEWHGDGGILDIKSKMPDGNDFTKWNKLTPRHNAFIEAITGCNMHIILTARGKDEYVLEQNEKGKQTPRKVGLGMDQRDGLEYECTIAFMLDMEHRAMVQKDNTEIFDGPDTSGQCVLLTEEHGEKIYEWAEEGKEFTYQKKIEQPSNTKESDELTGGEIARILQPHYQEKLNPESALFELNCIFDICGKNTAQRKAITDRIKKLLSEPKKLDKFIVEILKKYKAIQNFNFLIAKIPADLQGRWRDKKESEDMTTTDLEVFCLEMGKYINELEANNKEITDKIHAVDALIMQITNEDKRDQFISKRESCKTIEQYNNFIAEIENYIKQGNNLPPPPPVPGISGAFRTFLDKKSVKNAVYNTESTPGNELELH